VSFVGSAATVAELISLISDRSYDEMVDKRATLSGRNFRSESSPTTVLRQRQPREPQPQPQHGAGMAQ
jgi:hypothetical protein